ncbi:epsin-2 [Leptonychotes weddellii]|uniref:Epsin-2 n=1 Tax=Leptonychotes weddellii TaxID=9713 RepID=A0A7F8QQ33_LEPWE|nr:epsin-2 [Leptonychotes weddellii]
MATSSIRRQMKNIVNNYSEAEIKVREATSNDPWGPSSSLMTEIADLTYNVAAFSEIMSMVWKRLNDHGKNWRHVYKALTLLDYLIKTGSERVAQQCRENLFAVQTLKDFQYIDRDGKDQGINVREKSKQLVALLKDEERLKAERAQALKTKERMAQVATGVGSNQITFGRGSSQPNLSTSYSEQEYGKAGGSPASYHGSPEASLCPQHRAGAPLGQSEELQPLSQRHPFLPHLGLASRPNGDWSQPCLTCDRAARATSPRVSSELEQARPQTSGEEELQLQLALAMSREVAEQVGARQLSLPCLPIGAKPAASVDPWGVPTGTSTHSGPKGSDPWVAPQQPAPSAGKTADAWAAASAAKPVSSSGAFDLFSNLNGTIKDDFSEFDNLRTSKKTAEAVASPPSQNNGTTSPDPFECQPLTAASSKPSSARKTPESFLGPNAALVNLDSLVTRPAPPAQSLNPFLAPGAAAVSAPVNPFQVNQPQPLTLNQLWGSPVLGTSTSFGPSPGVEPMAVASMTSTAPHPALGASGSSLTPLGPASMNMVGSVGIPPSAAQAAGTTNPFLL